VNLPDLSKQLRRSFFAKAKREARAYWSEMLEPREGERNEIGRSPGASHELSHEMLEPTAPVSHAAGASLPDADGTAPAILTAPPRPLASECPLRMPEDPSDPSPLPTAPSAHEALGATGLPANVAGGLAVMIPLIGGVVFLVVERRDRFVRFYALQSIILGVLLGAAVMMLSLIQLIFQPIPFFGEWVITAGRFVYGIYALIWLALYFVTFVQAFLGRTWAIPYLGPVVKKYF
jgi:uncharacterized membrane protein